MNAVLFAILEEIAGMPWYAYVLLAAVTIVPIVLLILFNH